MTREEAEKRTILRAIVGSSAHGLNLPGQDDRDEMGVLVEPPEYVVGLRHFEQYVYRSQPEGVRSGPGDLDLTIYSLRKWCRLARSGNPTVLLLLFAPDFVKWTAAGDRLQRAWPLFAARSAATAFLGYLTAQKQRLLGERGGMKVHRPELVAAHSFDTKYAGHILRLGHQGCEFLETGRITLPMPEPERSRILRVRRGEVAFQDMMTEAGELEVRLADLRESSPLPPEPDHEAIDRLLIQVYRDAWDDQVDALQRKP